MESERTIMRSGTSDSHLSVQAAITMLDKNMPIDDDAAANFAFTDGTNQLIKLPPTGNIST